MKIEEILTTMLREEEEDKGMEGIIKLEENMQKCLDKIIKRFPNVEEVLDRDEEGINDYFKESSIKAVLQKYIVEKLVEDSNDVMALMIDYHGANKELVDGIINNYEEAVVYLFYLNIKQALTKSQLAREFVNFMSGVFEEDEDEDNVNVN